MIGQIIGETRFTYTDADMVATQRAGLTWVARWQTLLVAYGVLATLHGAIIVIMNIAHGTRGVPGDLPFLILGPPSEIAVVVAVMVWRIRKHGQQVLHAAPRQAADGDAMAGEHVWAWDRSALHIRHARCDAKIDADLLWSSISGWLDSPKVLLLYPPGRRNPFMPLRSQAAGWVDAPQVQLFPFGGPALALPKRALASGDVGRLRDALRAAGVPERRRFGLIAARDHSPSFESPQASLEPVPFNDRR